MFIFIQAKYTQANMAMCTQPGSISNLIQVHVCCNWLVLKTMDTIDNCQRPIPSLGVSKHNYA